MVEVRPVGQLASGEAHGIEGSLVAPCREVADDAQRRETLCDACCDGECVPVAGDADGERDHRVRGAEFGPADGVVQGGVGAHQARQGGGRAVAGRAADVHGQGGEIL